MVRNDGKFYKLTAEGNLVWDYDIGSAINSAPSLSSQGFLYFGSNDGRLTCIDINGIFKWNLITDHPIVAAPLIGDENIIYIGGVDGNVYIIKEYFSNLKMNFREESIFEWPTFKGNNKRSGYSGDLITETRDILSIPFTYELHQNYPNPFNPNTTIKYEIPKRSFVELRVYDILGKEVTQVVNEEQEAGYYEINFNAANLSSGIYLCQLKAGSFIDTKKMILLK